MGACLSSPEKRALDRASSEIARKNRADADSSSARVKLLLLGAGESGKSTILKQIRILYGKGYSESDRRAIVPLVHGNILSGMKQLIASNAEHGDALPEATASAATVITSLPANSLVDATVAAAMETLWADPTIRSVFAQRSKFQLPESVDYFFGRVREVATPGYVPNVDDVLNLRVRTSGIHCEEFIIDGVPFDVYDVGGQKSERRKWIHAFDDVTAVVFVAAISEFDQVMFEDESQNRLVDSLALFEEVVNSRHFAKASTILFLNKYDLFLKKLADGAKLQQPNAQPFAADKNPVLNADYTGGQDPDAAVRYLVAKYLGRCNDARRDIFWRVTCATDTGSVGTVLLAAKETILRQNLLDSGLMA